MKCTRCNRQALDKNSKLLVLSVLKLDLLPVLNAVLFYLVMIKVMSGVIQWNPNNEAKQHFMAHDYLGRNAWLIHTVG